MAKQWVEFFFHVTVYYSPSLRKVKTRTQTGQVAKVNAEAMEEGYFLACSVSFVFTPRTTNVRYCP